MAKSRKRRPKVMSRLSRIAAENYVATNGAMCPYCRTEDPSVGEVRQRTVGFEVPAKCNYCSKEWIEEYTLTAIKEIPCTRS